jgi:DNA-binding transcriptional MocR family regulator
VEVRKSMWVPAALPTDTPLYLALAAALERDVANGRLAPGTQLPPQRALAKRLGIDFTTVTRAYAEAANRGLVVGQVGRGTFVRASRREPSVARDAFSIDPHAPPVDVDLALNLPPQVSMDEAARALSATLGDLRGWGGLGGLLEYLPNAGRDDHRAAGALWLARRTRDRVAPERVVICAGAHHAMTALLLTLARPGDLVLAEPLTYPPFVALARRLHLRVAPAELTPDAFRTACRAHKPRALYCMPTVHNPTGATMSLALRQQIAAIADQYGVAIIEDDTYGALLSRAPRALSAIAPGPSYLIGTLSKALAPLRIAYVMAPDGEAADEVAGAVRATAWTVAPLMAEIAARWIQDGMADTLLRVAREEMTARHALAREILGGSYGAAESLHVWIPRQKPAAELAARIREAGVNVIAGETFAVDPARAPFGLRVSLSAAPSRDALQRGLEILVSEGGLLERR